MVEDTARTFSPCVSLYRIESEETTPAAANSVQQRTKYFITDVKYTRVVLVIIKIEWRTIEDQMIWTDVVCALM